MVTLTDNVGVIAASLPQLAAERRSSALANDVYEAAGYWVQLGRSAIENDTRINFPARATEENGLLRTLESAAAEASKREKYEAVFAAAQLILNNVVKKIPDRGGHLDILKVLDQEFAFLERDYGFRIVSEEPTGRKYSSGKVWIELKWSPSTPMSCAFGKEPDNTPFWPAVLLHMNGDSRYLDIWNGRPLQNRHDVEVWFHELADIWRKYGQDVLTAQPGAFDKATDALTQIDADIDRAARDGG